MSALRGVLFASALLALMSSVGASASDAGATLVHLDQALGNAPRNPRGYTIATVFRNERASIAVARAAGQPLHRRQVGDEYIYIIEGSGTAQVADKTYSVAPGDLLVIPQGLERSFTSSGGEFKTLVVTVPPDPADR